MKIRVFAAGLCAVLVLAAVFPVAAVEPHEDPEAAVIVFDGVALLQKYSQALDGVIEKNPAGLERLQAEAIPANIPPILRNTVDRFLSSGYSLAGLIPLLEADLEELKTLLAQYRIDDVRQSLAMTGGRLSQAYSYLLTMNGTALDTGRYWQADTAHAESALLREYGEVQGKLQRVRQLLDLLDNIYRSLTQQTTTIISENRPLPTGPGITPAGPGITTEPFLQPTNLTLSVEPEKAFIGDKVRFLGMLRSDGRPLSGRIVTLLLDHTPVSAKLTGEDGVFQADVALPYRYVSDMTAQAIFYPEGNDIGKYLGSSSPIVTINTLYYKTGINLETSPIAYPGRTLLLKGSLDYGNNPEIDSRSLSVYWDGELAAETFVAANFSLEIPVVGNTTSGRHRLALYIAPWERYAPAQAVEEVEVTRVAPTIDADFPAVVFLPFTQDIKGKVYSPFGPLQDAGLEIALAGWNAYTRSQADGTFNARLRTGMSLTLFGSQELRVTVTPSEPWYKKSTLTVRPLVINPVNITGLLLILIIPAFIGMLRLRRKVVPVTNRTVPEQVPAALIKENFPRVEVPMPASGDRLPAILNLLCKKIFSLVQEITAVALLPYHTLREFARETAPRLRVLGPALINDFQEFISIVERILYSPHRPTESEADRARELGRRMLKESKE